MKLKKSEKILFVITLFVALSALIYLRLPFGTIGSTVEIRKELSRKKIYLEHLNYLLENAGSIKKKWQRIKEREVKTPANFKTAPVLDGIYKIARASGINKISGITPMQLRVFENYPELPVQINFHASVESTMKFIYNVENNEKPLSIEYLNVYPDSEETGLVFCQMTVTALDIGARRETGAGKLHFSELSGNLTFKPAYSLYSEEMPVEKKDVDMTLRELEDSLVVSGFVFDGNVTKALIENRRRGTGAEFYKEGDILEGAKVMKISEKDSEVILIYPGNKRIVLRMGRQREHGGPRE